jgi:hypothetical protein
MPLLKYKPKGKMVKGIKVEDRIVMGEEKDRMLKDHLLNLNHDYSQT